ncbi:MAG: MBOAT family protein [Erysipelotrichaceae bacterium]|nr:MBOAT family protein [Erysipelotrichaceae bacterium]
MLFSSLTFLFVFLPVLIVLYFVLPFRWYKNTLLLAVSLLFYSWGEPFYIVLMIVMILLNYCFGLLISINQKKKLILGLAIFVNFLVLFYFKYFNFFMDNLKFLFGEVHIDVVMPIGISFYTFQIVSYLIDVYRQDVKVQKNPIYFGCYVTLFPQLIAGPIVRYIDVEKAMIDRKVNFSQIADGIRRFCIGLGKKVLLANHAALVADKIFHPDFELTFTAAWVGAIAFALQIYYDFGGYSDMAIGLGKILGFEFNENFNYPYISKSITDFWRRWHISLSSWFRDYVYIPLGGNRCSKPRWVFNMFVVWALTGLWHGAAWNFVLWGLYFFFVLVIEKLLIGKWIEKIYVVRRVYALLLILIGWVIFNCSSVEHIMTYLKTMFTGYEAIDLMIFRDMNASYVIPYLVVGLIAVGPWFKKLFDWMNRHFITGIMYDLFCLGVLAICVVMLINNSYNPFIYFRF